MKEFIRLLRLFRPYRGWVAVGILVSLCSVLANIALMSVSGWFIMTMGLAGVTGAAVNYFTPAAIIRACAMVRTAGRYAERLISHETTFRFMAEMRLWLYERIEAMPLEKSSRYHSGDLLARLRGDIDTLEGFYIDIVMPSVVAFFALIVLVSVFAMHSVFLALVQLALLLTVGVVIPLVSSRIGKTASRKIIEQKAVLKTQMVDNIQNLAEMTVYGVAQSRMQQAQVLSDDLIEMQRRMGVADGVSQGLNGLLTNLGLWSALVIVLMLYQQNSVTAPQLPMLVLLALASFEAVTPLATAFQSLEGCLQAARRIFAFEDTVENTEEKPMIDISNGFDLVMRGIDFSYPDRPHVLQDFSLELHKGAITKLVGPSGMGKSSVIALLTGLYQADQGSIELNGTDVTHWPSEWKRGYYAVVPQHPYLFAGTIRTNLLLAKPDATTQELDAVCKIACLDRFIASLAQGYDSYVGQGGVTLSGGEIRRIAIARALLKDAPCVLLDEPTEGLDRQTAENVMRNLAEYARDKAVLLITHDADIVTN